MAVVAVDFDGVLHAGTFKELDMPVDNATTGMMQLHRQGHKLIIFSSRAATPAIRRAMGEWLRNHRIVYDDITNIKPQADYYLDDKAIKFTDWSSALEQIR